MSANTPLFTPAAIERRPAAWANCGTLALSLQDVACMLANGLNLHDIPDVLPEQDAGALMQQAQLVSGR